MRRKPSSEQISPSARLRRASIPAGLALLFLAAASIGAGPEEAGWPQWRGPERTGHSPGSQWPETLGGISPLWRAELDKGYSGPIVSAGAVFVTETAGKETEVVRALDRRTGREMWRASWPGKVSVPFFAKRSGDWIRSTPASDGRTLYVGGMEEVLVALDAETGKERWRVEFPKRFGTPKPEFGFASSPLLDGDALFVQAANSVVRLDARTGRTIWRGLEHDDNIMESGAFSSPVIVQIAGRRQLLVQTRQNLLGVDPESGRQLWSHPVPNFRGMNILTPVVYRDAVFTSPYRVNSFLFRISQQAGEFAVQEVWRNKVKGYMSSPVVIGDYAYLHLANQRFTCIDLRSGELRWTSGPFGQYWSLAYRGEKILALDESGELHLIRANPDRFELLDSREISAAPSWGHIAVVGRELFVRELTGIAAYRWESSEVRARAAN